MKKYDGIIMGFGKGGKRVGGGVGEGKFSVGMIEGWDKM